MDIKDSIGIIANNFFDLDNTPFRFESYRASLREGGDPDRRYYVLGKRREETERIPSKWMLYIDNGQVIWKNGKRGEELCEEDKKYVNDVLSKSTIVFERYKDLLNGFNWANKRILELQDKYGKEVFEDLGYSDVSFLNGNKEGQDIAVLGFEYKKEEETLGLAGTFFLDSAIEDPTNFCIFFAGDGLYDGENPIPPDDVAIELTVMIRVVMGQYFGYECE